MKFDVIRHLCKAEQALDRHIDAASKQLSEGADGLRLANAFRAGKPVVKHRNWHAFLQFARPIGEARQHISDERAMLERSVENEITRAVKSLSRRKK